MRDIFIFLNQSKYFYFKKVNFGPNLAWWTTVTMCPFNGHNGHVQWTQWTYIVFIWMDTMDTLTRHVSIEYVHWCGIVHWTQWTQWSSNGRPLAPMDAQMPLCPLCPLDVHWTSIVSIGPNGHNGKWAFIGSNGRPLHVHCVHWTQFTNPHAVLPNKIRIL